MTCVDCGQVLNRSSGRRCLRCKRCNIRFRYSERWDIRGLLGDVAPRTFAEKFGLRPGSVAKAVREGANLILADHVATRTGSHISLLPKWEEAS